MVAVHRVCMLSADAAVLRILTSHAPAQGTEAWLQWRKTRLTASDAVKVTGNAVKSMATLIEQKTSPGAVVFSGNEFTRSGHLNEPIAAARYAAFTGFVLHTNLRPVEHPVYPWLGASLDGVTGCGRNVEIKTLHGPKIFRKPKSAHVQQAQIQMACAQLPVSDLVYFYVDMKDEQGQAKLDVHTVPYDADWFAEKLPKFKAFALELQVAQSCCYQLRTDWELDEIHARLEQGRGVQDQTPEDMLQSQSDYKSPRDLLQESQGFHYQCLNDSIPQEDMWIYDYVSCSSSVLIDTVDTTEY